MTLAGKNRSGAAPFGRRSACALCERAVFGPGLCPDCHARFRQGLSDALFTLGAAVAVPCAVVAAFLVLTYGQTAPADAPTPEGMVRTWRWFLPPWANAAVWQLVGSFLGAAGVALASFLLLDLPRTLRKEPRPEVHWRDMARSLRNLRLIFEKRVTPATPAPAEQPQDGEELDYRTAMRQLHDMLGIEEEVPEEPLAPMEPAPRKTIPLTSWGSTSPRMKPPQLNREPGEPPEEEPAEVDIEPKDDTENTEQQAGSQSQEWPQTPEGAEEPQEPRDMEEVLEAEEKPQPQEPSEPAADHEPPCGDESKEALESIEAQQPEGGPLEETERGSAVEPDEGEDEPPHGNPTSEAMPGEPEEDPGPPRPGPSPVPCKPHIPKPRKVHVQDSPFAQRHRIGDPLFETVFSHGRPETDTEDEHGEFVSAEPEPEDEFSEPEAAEQDTAAENVEFEVDDDSEEQQVVAEVDAFLDTPEVPGILTLRPTDSQELDFAPSSPTENENERPETPEETPPAANETTTEPEPELASEPEPDFPTAQAEQEPLEQTETDAPASSAASTKTPAAAIRFLSPSGTDDLPQAVTDGENMATCPGCGRRRRSPGPGRYRCSGCGDEFVIPAAVARCPRCGRERPCPPPGKYLCSNCETTFRVPAIIACPGCGRSRPSPGEGRFRCSTCGIVFEVLADETVR